MDGLTSSNFSWPWHTNNCWEHFSHLHPPFSHLSSILFVQQLPQIESIGKAKTAKYSTDITVFDLAPLIVQHRAGYFENWSDLDRWWQEMETTIWLFGIFVENDLFIPIHRCYTYLCLILSWKYMEITINSSFFQKTSSPPTKKHDLCSLASALAWKNRITVAAFGAGNHRQGIPLLLASVPRWRHRYIWRWDV